MGPFFEEYLVPGAKAFVPRRWPTADEAVRLIHEAGGAAVVAHPYWDVSEPAKVEELIRALDVDGIEAFYPAHTREQTAHLLQLCVRTRPGPDRLLRLPRPDPQDLLPLRRLPDLRARRARGPSLALDDLAAGLRALTAARRPEQAFASDAISTWARLSRPRISTRTPIRPAIANPAPPRKAAWKPSVSAAGSADFAPPAAAIASEVREVAIVESSARPSAPPTCWAVLIRPLARPASRSVAPETAAIVTGTKANPSPTAASSEGPRMSVRKPPSTETCENQSSPAAIRARPVASTGLNPTLVTSCEAIPAETMIDSASGR